MTTTFHQLDPALFEAVAGGGGGAAAIDELHAAQVSKHLLLIGHLADAWADAGPVLETLERARLADPDAFRDVIGAPLVGAWAAIATRALLAGRAVPADFAHLGAIAVVACAATGVDGSADVPVRDGLAVLPGLGADEVGGVETVRATVTGGRIRVAGSTGWQPVRRLGDWLELDDLHPYRHGHHVPPAPRLDAGEVTRWQEVFDEAWALLAGRLPERAAEVRAGLRTLVPLVQLDPRSARSATIRHAFGVFGLTRPPSAADFAVTMVHEFQHSKLSAVLDLMPLTDPADTGRYFAPWRTDPRPLAGLVQGVYAFAGVADTWRALRGVSAVAEARFAEARLQVDRGLTSVEQSGALTDEGQVLARRLRAVTDAMLAEDVAPAIARAAEDTLERTRRAWIERNASEPA